MQFSSTLLQVALFFGLIAVLTNAATLEVRQNQYICGTNGSRGSCDTNNAGICIRTLKSLMATRSDGFLSFRGDLGAFSGGCRCYASCRTGEHFPDCFVTSHQVDVNMYGLRDACISSAASAVGYVYADSAKWEFARYP